MAGILRKGMSWLGLGADEDYDDYYDDDDSSAVTVDVTGNSPTLQTGTSVRPISTPGRARIEPETTGSLDTPNVKVVPAGSVSAIHREVSTIRPERVQPRGESRSVRAVASTRPYSISPKSFEDAQEVGDRFRKSQPVLLNLQDLDRALARRLLDFSSGVTYGLSGKVERIASHVYLLTPADVEISADDRRRMRDNGHSEE